MDLNNNNMMNKIFCLILISLLSFTKYKEPNFSLKILSSKIKDGKNIIVELKNNTKYNYCFVMDTLFPYIEYPHYYYLDAFYNPKIVLYDNSNNKVFELIKDESIPEFSVNDSVISVNKNNSDEIIKTNRENFNFIMVKSHSAIQLKIPFKIITRLNHGSFSYYKLEKGEDYYGKIDYLIKQKFIDKRISVKSRDSIHKIGYKFFTGKLVSNKVPLILK